MPILTLQNIKTAEDELGRVDSIMKGLMAHNRPLTLKTRHTPFQHIATSIINQQLSQKAAACIENRILAMTPMQSECILTIKADVLREAGLSWRKIDYLKTLAQADAEQYLDVAVLKKMDNEAVIKHLCALKGVGRWTAEMFLMFALRRSDIVALDDAGLQRAAKMHYGKDTHDNGDTTDTHDNTDTHDTKVLLDKIAQQWQPWQTVGCWHLWRSLE